MDELGGNSREDSISESDSSVSAQSVSNDKSTPSGSRDSTLEDDDDTEFVYPTKSVWSYLCHAKYASTLDISAPTWYLNNNLQAAKDWIHLASSNRGSISADIDAVSALEASTALFQQLDEVMAINNVLASGASGDSIKSLAEEISVVAAARGFCHILKALGDDDRILRLRIESNQHPIHFFITGNDDERPSQDDFPKTSEQAIWKASTFPNHPSVCLTVDCRKYHQWKSLLVTAFNESQLLAHIDVKHIASGSQLKRDNQNSLTVKQNLALRITKIKCNQQQWKKFKVRVKSIHQRRARGNNLHSKRKLDWQLLSVQKFALKLVCASRFLQAVTKNLHDKRNKSVPSEDPGESHDGHDISAENESQSEAIEIEQESQPENHLPPLFSERPSQNSRVRTLEGNSQSMFSSFRLNRAKTYQPGQESQRTDNRQSDASFEVPRINEIAKKAAPLDIPDSLCLDRQHDRETIRRDRLSLLASLASEPGLRETARQRRKRQLQSQRDQHKLFLLMSSRQEFARLRSRPCSPPELKSRI